MIPRASRMSLLRLISIKGILEIHCDGNGSLCSLTDGRTFPRVIPRPARVRTHGDPHYHSSAHSCSDMDWAGLDRATAGGWSKVGYRGRTICGLWFDLWKLVAVAAAPRAPPREC